MEALGLELTVYPSIEWVWEQLQWDPEYSFLSNTSSAVVMVILYLVGVFYLRHYLKDKPVANWRPLLAAHSSILAVGSAILLFILASHVFPQIWNHGLHWSMCTSNALTKELERVYYVNYLFKYVEFIDTVFLVIHRKPLSFLHVYHHAATALLCVTQLHGRASVQWAVILPNLAVHTVMYTYYALAATGRRPRWRIFVTIFQISQFVWDVCAVYYAAILMFASRDNPDRFQYCQGTPFVAISGPILLTTYLLLFIDVFKKNYGVRRPQIVMGPRQDRSITD